LKSYGGMPMLSPRQWVELLDGVAC
jgi:hypothetical protein